MHDLSSEPAQRLTAEQIHQRVQELGPWFHNIDLCGIKTAPEHFLGDYPALKWRRFAPPIAGARSDPRARRSKSVRLSIHATWQQRGRTDCG